VDKDSHIIDFIK